MHDKDALESPVKEKAHVGEELEPEEVHLTSRPPVESRAPEELKQKAENDPDDWANDEHKEVEEASERPFEAEDAKVVEKPKPTKPKSRSKKKKNTHHHEHTGSEGEIEMDMIAETAREKRNLPQNSIGQLQNSGF